MKWIVFWIVLTGYTAGWSELQKDEYGIQRYVKVEELIVLSRDTMHREFSTKDSADRFVRKAPKGTKFSRIDTIWVKEEIITGMLKVVPQTIYLKINQ